MPPTTARARRRHVPARATSRDDVIAAGLRLIDAEGLGGLSMRRLADELGVSHMTIYNYVESRDHLLDEIARAALAGLEHDADADLPWRDQLVELLRDLRHTLRNHPGLTELILSRPPPVPGFDPSRETVLKILRSAGFDVPEAADALTALACYVVGYAHVESVRDDDTAADAETERLHALDPKRFPNLLEAADNYSHHASDRAFETGLQSLIDGLATRSRIATS